MTEATQLLSVMLQKPEKFIMIVIEKPEMMFAGEYSPCLYAELKSIGLPEEKTTEMSSDLCSFFYRQLGVPANRVYIEFSDAERHMLGWDNKTFQK